MYQTEQWSNNKSQYLLNAYNIPGIILTTPHISSNPNTMKYYEACEVLFSFTAWKPRHKGIPSLAEGDIFQNEKRNWHSMLDSRFYSLCSYPVHSSVALA